METTSPAIPSRSRGPGDLFAGRYRVERRLGQGGMGIVYLVRDLRHQGRRVALKHLSAERSDTESAALRQEFLSSVSLDHVNIAPAIEFGLDRETGSSFFTSEYVAGAPLLEKVEHLDLGRSDGIEELFLLFAQLLRALDFIHSRGLVYGDVKPEHLLVGSAGRSSGHVKLIDFGLVERESRRRGRRVWATPSYVAPEKILGALVDRRADLYSVGIVLYQAVTGRLPFSGVSNLDLLKGHVERTPLAPCQLAPRLPAAMDALILHLLEKDPVQRPQSACEVIDEINHGFGLTLPLETAATQQSYLNVGEISARDEELQRLSRVLRSACASPEAERPATDEATGAALARLAEAGEGSVVPRGRCVLLRGEEGSGRRVLLNQLRHFAQAHGVEVIDVSSDGNDDRDALIRLLDQLRGLWAHTRDPLAVEPVLILRALLEESLADSSSTPSQEVLRSAMARAALSVVDLSQSVPLAFFFRGLDRNCASLVPFARSLSAAATEAPSSMSRYIVVASCQSSDPLEKRFFQELLAPAATPGQILCFDLDPLGLRRVRRVVESAFRQCELPAAMVERVAEESDGNVRNVLQVLEFLLERETIVRRRAGWYVEESHLDDHFLGPVREDIQDRICELSGEAYRLAVSFAVLGGFSDVALACAVAKISEEQRAPCLETLLEKKILKERLRADGSPQLLLANSGTRSTLYGLLAENERRALHELTGRLLERYFDEQGATDFTELAHHFLSARHRDKGIHYGMEAARQLADEFALDRAVTTYQRVLDLLDGTDSEEARLIGKEIALLRYRVGDFTGVVRGLASFRGAARTEAASLEMRVLASRALGRLGRFEEGERLLRSAVDNLPSSAPAELRAELALGQAEWHQARDEHVQSLRHCGRAQELLEDGGRPELLARVLLLRGECYAALGASQDAARCGQKALRLIDATRDRRLVAASLMSRATFYEVRHQFQPALRQLNLCLLLEKQSNAFVGVADCMLRLGTLHRRLGNPREARRFLETALSVYRRIESRPQAIDAECELAEVNRLLGHTQTAVAQLSAAARQAASLDKRITFDRALWSLSAAAYDRGDFEGGDATLDRLARRPSSRRVSSSGLRIGLLRSEAALLRGNFGAAVEEARTLVLEARQHKNPLWIARGLRQQSLLQLWVGRNGEARRPMAALMDLAVTQGLPLEEGWGRYLEARALVSEGLSGAATKAFCLARDAMAEHGGPRDLAELYLHRGWFHLTQAQYEDSYVDLEEGLHLARTLDLPHVVAWYQIARAIHEWCVSGPEEARVRDRLLDAVEKAAVGPFPEPMGQAHHRLAELAGDTGHPDSARGHRARSREALEGVISNLPASIRRVYLEQGMFAGFTPTSSGADGQSEKGSGPEPVIA